MEISYSIDMCRKSLGIWIESIYIHVLCCLEAKFVLCSCVLKLYKVNISTYQHLAFLHQTLFLNAGAPTAVRHAYLAYLFFWKTPGQRGYTLTTRRGVEL